MRMIWFLRMAKWARRPPSGRQVVYVLGIILACLVIFGIERYVGFPDWLMPEGGPRGRISRP